MNVVIVHDVETPFGFFVLIHVFEDDQSFETLELLVLLELLIHWEVLVKVELV